MKKLSSLFLAGMCLLLSSCGNGENFRLVRPNMYMRLITVDLMYTIGSYPRMKLTIGSFG